MTISPNPTPTIYRNLYENTGPGHELIKKVVDHQLPIRGQTRRKNASR